MSQLTAAVLDARRRVLDITARAGKALLSSQFPDDFEYYMCALELVDATDSNNILDYVVFPIMPDNIRISEDKIQNTTKTSNGVVVLENFSFVPKNITISGNFGRRIKPMNAGGESFPIALTSEKVTSAVDNSLNKKITLPEFSITAKSGYGITKILERMFEKSSSLVNGVPVQLFFYNFAFNSHYLVQPINVQFFQNRNSTNMIWEYSMSFLGIAPAEELRTDSDYKNTLNKYLKEDVLSGAVSEILDFAGDQAKILSNVLQYQAGEITGLNESSNKIPQLIRAPF